MGPLGIFLSLPFFSSSFRQIFVGLLFLAIFYTQIQASVFSSVFTTNNACSSVVHIFGSYLFVVVGSVYECLSTTRRATRNEDAAIISISVCHRQLLFCEYLSTYTFERPRPQASCHMVVWNGCELFYDEFPIFWTNSWFSTQSVWSIFFPLHFLGIW